MAEKRIPSILSGFFNEKGQGHSLGGYHTLASGERVELVENVPASRPVRTFAEELKALSPADKQELAEGVVAFSGDTIAA